MICENVFYLHDASDAIFADPLTVCNDIFTAAVAHIVPQASAAVFYNSVGFEDIRTVPFGGLTLPQTPAQGTLAGAGAGVPSTIALAVKKSTGTLGRSGRGRWYWPIGDISNILAGETVPVAFANAVVTALSAFQVAVEAALTPAEFGIVSYQVGGVARAAGQFERVLGWGVTDLTLDTQIRRGLHRGR